MSGTPHKHAAVIKAWADGAVVETSNAASEWVVVRNPGWHKSQEYRVVDPYRELREAQNSGKVLQYLDGSGDWADWSLPMKFNYPPNRYRIRPQNEDFRLALKRGERVDFNADLDYITGWVEMLPTHVNSDVWTDFGPENFRIALPWQDERDAQAQGKTVQYRSHPGDPWTSMHCCFESTNPQGEYRVKPEVKTVTIDVDEYTLVGKKEDFPSFKSIALDVTSEDGKVTNVTVKGWSQ